MIPLIVEPAIDPRRMPGYIYNLDFVVPSRQIHGISKPLMPNRLRGTGDDQLILFIVKIEADFLTFGWIDWTLYSFNRITAG